MVYCGTVGLMPLKTSRWQTKPRQDWYAGDIVFMVELVQTVFMEPFSSLELTEESPSSAVQIGDPITQKLLDDP